MVVDASPALAVLDKLVSSENSTTGPVAGQPTNTQLIKQLTDELEQALGILNPMVIEDLNKEIQEEHTDPELIREALKEAVFNRKTNWNYIKGVLRNWKLSGITTKIQVEERRLSIKERNNIIRFRMSSKLVWTRPVNCGVVNNVG